MKPWKRPHFVSSITTAKLKYIHFYNVFSYKIFKQELLTNGWIERHQDSTSSNKQVIQIDSTVYVCVQTPIKVKNGGAYGYAIYIEKLQKKRIWQYELLDFA